MSESPRFTKGFAFAQKQCAQFGVEQTKSTMESVFAANPGRPATDEYVMGVRAGMAAAGEAAA